MWAFQMKWAKKRKKSPTIVRPMRAQRWNPNPSRNITRVCEIIDVNDQHIQGICPIEVVHVSFVMRDPHNSTSLWYVRWNNFINSSIHD